MKRQHPFWSGEGAHGLTLDSCMEGRPEDATACDSDWSRAASGLT
jgi:hypothetical protein